MSFCGKYQKISKLSERVLTESTVNFQVIRPLHSRQKARNALIVRLFCVNFAVIYILLNIKVIKKIIINNLNIYITY